MSTGRSSSRILLGRIVGAHGIRGDVLVKTFTEVPDSIGAYGPLSDADGTRSFRLRSVRPTAKGAVARVDGVTDRNGAEALKGVDLYVERNRLPPPAEGEFYHADLVGLAAVDTNGMRIGTVVAVHNFGAGDILDIRLSGSSKSEMVPFTDAFVPEIDITGGKAVVRLALAGGEDKDDDESAPETS